MDPSILFEAYQASNLSIPTFTLGILLWLGMTVVLVVLAAIRVRLPIAVWIFPSALIVTAGEIWTILAHRAPAVAGIVEPIEPLKFDVLGLTLGAITLALTAWMASLTYTVRIGTEPRTTLIRAFVSLLVAIGGGAALASWGWAEGGQTMAAIGATALITGVALAFMGSRIGSEHRDRKRMHRARRMVTLASLGAVACAAAVAWDSVHLSGGGGDPLVMQDLLTVTAMMGLTGEIVVLAAAIPILLARILDLIGLRSLFAGILIATVVALPVATRVVMWMLTR